MITIRQITASGSSPAVQVGIVAVGCLVLFVIFKIGGVIFKLLLGLAVISVIGWFKMKMTQ